MNARHPIFFAIVILGAYSQVVQAWLIRESLVVFYGNEVSLGAFFGSWLAWVTVGAIGVVWLRRRAWIQRPLPVLRLLILALPPLLLLQVLAVRGIRLFLDVSAAEFVPLGELFLSLLMITAPTGLALGVAFPLACKALRNTAVAAGVGGDAAAPAVVREVSGLYVLEAVGALLGGVAFTFLIVEWLGVWRGLGWLTCLLGVSAVSLCGGPRGAGFAGVAVAALGLALALTPLAGWLQARMEALRFHTLQPGMSLLDAVETRYGHVAVARLGAQVSVLGDGRVSASFPQPQAVAQQAAYLYAQSDGARRVLMFGGLAGGLAAELLRYPITHLEVVEPDRVAFDHIRPYLTPEGLEALQDPRLHLRFMDGRRFANRLTGDAGYDLVLVMDAAPTSAYSNRYFTLEFYRQLRHAMAPEGVFCTQVSSASNYLGRAVKSYSGSVFRTLSEVFPHIAVAPGDYHLYCASAAPHRVTEDPAELEGRYLDTPLDEYRFPSVGFYTLLPPERVAFVRDQLTQEQGELNTDMKPVTYYLNMVLWGKFSASAFVDWLDALRRMGPWPYLIPWLVYAGLMLLRGAAQGDTRARLQRRCATNAMVILGLIAMAVQLALLFSYQARVGFVFGRIALLNALFMTGLAVGAGGIGQRLARTRHSGLALATLLALLALALAGLPQLLQGLGTLDSQWQELVYLSLSAAAGLLTGVGFPLGVQQTHQDTAEVVHTSGLIDAADNLGGAAGGLLTGALLVPILGVGGTCYLLAALALIAFVPVLYAQFAPGAVPALRVRGARAFPWPGLSAGLMLVVITVFLWSVLARGLSPGPRVHFDETTLEAVSGSKALELKESPMPHYLGTNAPGSRPETVSLASMAAAPDVRGYAGPVNLLVAVDGQGRLRGVRYVDSDETPSYIAGIDQWLAGLAGDDLSRAGLDLDHVDGLSGATVTSRAVLRSINRAAQAGGQAAFGRHFATEPAGQGQAGAWRSPQFWVTLILLALFFPVYLSGREWARLVYQAMVLLVLGFALNTLVTEIDLVNLSLGHWASLTSNPQRWLLLGFVALTALAFGQVYCGYVCPFGALQEFLSRLGRLLYLRSYPERPLETRMRFLKYLLLAVMLLGVWVSGESLWASFNPMQHVFGAHLEGWLGAITLLSLLGAVLYYRFWCRYLCPFGAFLALSNKLALLRRLAPARRFEHCDLGVRDEYDVDCIHCNRCLSAKDFGVRPPRKRSHAHRT
jgi:spermidine synthase